MDAIRLASGLLLPLALGVAMLLALRATRLADGAPGELAWLAGAGYLTGAFSLTLWMRALSAIGVHFGVAVIALPLLAASAVLLAIAWRRDGAAIIANGGKALRALVDPPVANRAATILWRLAIAWIALRFALLGLEIGWRPLFPWDAWIQWATKAKVWYELGQMVPFARSEAWFAAGGAAWFDAAPNYPATVPLLQVWSSIALGRFDDALMNWPWWQIAFALTLAVYGALRQQALTPIASLLGACLVATLPFANVHVALAGYADLPLAAYYTVAVLSFLRWNDSRRAGDAALMLILLAACPMIKTPGTPWALTVLPGVVVALAPRNGVKYAAAGLAAVAFLLAVLAQTNAVILGYRLRLEFAPEWRALGDSFFLLGNWNLLWYAAIGVALLAGRRLVTGRIAPLTAIVAAGLVFLFIVFAFTNAREWVADYSTINRATLHIAPLIVIFTMLGFREFAQRWSARQADGDEPAGASATTG